MSDGKCQVTVRYEDNKPKDIKTIVVSAQTKKGVKFEEVKRIIKEEVLIPLLGSTLDGIEILVNPTGALFRGGAVITTWKLGSSLSLWMFIFTARPYDLKLIQHEYGHTVQSLILGPIWSLVIGLPSLIYSGCFSKYREKHNISYYSFYTESRANKLGKNVILL